MRVKTKSTWSQQQLAFKLGMHPAAKNSFFSWERKRLLIHAAKTAFAAGVCWWLALLVGLHDGYWGAISAIIVLQSNFGATVTASRDRILGTLIGAVLGFSFSLFGALPWNYILAVFAAMVLCGLLGFRSSSRLAGVTITIVMLVQAGSHHSIALVRVVDVVLGILVALGVTTLIFPDRARIALRDGLAQEFLVLGAFFEAILKGFRGARAEDLESLRQDAVSCLESNNELLEASRHEPSGGPGWREGLAVLTEFGRALFDLLVALELAVKGSSDDAYAQQLEPALGHLATDIYSGFHYVAGCIHKWRFFLPPAKLHLEDDIAKLDEKMAGARTTGITYSQAEILRAYALLLHLNQIARLLRASRIETNRVVGHAGGNGEGGSAA
jgi:hypothetical protein